MDTRTGLGIVLGLFVLIPNGLNGESTVRRRSFITVAVCDLAGIDARMRLHAKAEAIRILADARVDITWIDLDRDHDTPAYCATPSLPSYFFVGILPIAEDWVNGPDPLGFAALTTGPYRRAYVFRDRIEDLAKRCKAWTSHTGVILGHVIAHELGHLLGEAHAPNGIMRPSWGPRQCEEAASARLMFYRPLAN